jgi:hypothetical protein
VNRYTDHFPAVAIVEPLNQLNYCTFAATAAPDQSHGLALWYVKGEASKYFDVGSGRVRELNAPELDVPFAYVRLFARSFVDQNQWHSVQQFEDMNRCESSLLIVRSEG